MSDFSDLLDHAIARSNLSMLELQEASGIPISYLYKLRKGVRFTKKYTPNVLSLIYALQCPKAEEARLLQEFRGGGLAAIFDAVNLLTPARIETQAALWDEALAAFGPDIAAVHVKDAVVKDGALAPALLGEGVMCYDNIMRWLAQHKPGVALLREEIAPETAARDLAVMRAWAGR